MHAVKTCSSSSVFCDEKDNTSHHTACTATANVLVLPHTSLATICEGATVQQVAIVSSSSSASEEPQRTCTTPDLSFLRYVLPREDWL